MGERGRVVGTARADALRWPVNLAGCLPACAGRLGASVDDGLTGSARFAAEARTYVALLRAKSLAATRARQSLTRQPMARRADARFFDLFGGPRNWQQPPVHACRAAWCVWPGAG